MQFYSSTALAIALCNLQEMIAFNYHSMYVCYCLNGNIVFLFEGCSPVCILMCACVLQCCVFDVQTDQTFYIGYYLLSFDRSLRYNVSEIFTTLKCSVFLVCPLFSTIYCFHLSCMNVIYQKYTSCTFPVSLI